MLDNQSSTSAPPLPVAPWIVDFMPSVLKRAGNSSFPVETPRTNLPKCTIFIVARAHPWHASMWLLSKNEWGSSWSGYGVAVQEAGLRPWIHLGSDSGSRGFFQLNGNIDSTFRIFEFTHNGSIVQSYLDGKPDAQQAVKGQIATNTQPLTIGARPMQFFQGDIAEILVYRRALNEQERLQTSQYLREKYGVVSNAPETGGTPLVSDWLFQAEERPLLERARQEIGWTRQLIGPPAQNRSRVELSKKYRRVGRAGSKPWRIPPTSAQA